MVSNGLARIRLMSGFNYLVIGIVWVFYEYIELLSEKLGVGAYVFSCSCFLPPPRDICKRWPLRTVWFCLWLIVLGYEVCVEWVSTPRGKLRENPSYCMLCVMSVGNDVVGRFLSLGETMFGVLSCFFASRGRSSNSHRCAPYVVAMLSKKNMCYQRGGRG